MYNRPDRGSDPREVLEVVMCRVYCLVVALGCVMSTAGVAAQEPLDPGRLDQSLAGLRFGASKEEVTSFLKARTAARYDGMIQATADIREKDKLRREKEEAIAATATEWVSFDGTRSGWDASIVREEFQHGCGEEMLHVKEGEIHLYFFFSKGIFYKLARTGAARPVAQYMDELVKVYGNPTETRYQDEKTRAVVKSATWKAGRLRLEIEDRTRLYQAALVRWTSTDLEPSVAAERARAGGRGNEINPLINKAKAKSEEEVDPVDVMIGAPTPVPQKPKKKK